MRCLVSAIADELKNLVSRIGGNPDQQETVWVFPDLDLVVGAVGVGYLESAVRLSRLLQQFPDISALIFTGSAGVYANVSSIKPGELCACRQTLLADLAAESGSGHYASLLEREALPSTLDLNNQLYPASVATLLSLTKDATLAQKLTQNLGVELENMELYGVARVCREYNVAWNAVLGITNTVGSKGHEEWKQNYRQLAVKTSDFLYQWSISGS